MVNGDIETELNCQGFLGSSIHIEHQGQVSVSLRDIVSISTGSYRYYLPTPASAGWQSGRVIALEFDRISNCTEFNTTEIVYHLCIMYCYLCHIVLVILALHWAMRPQIYEGKSI